MTVYISIGNSDDKLTQAEWSAFAGLADKAIRFRADEVHGAWYSLPGSPWQNACWCIEIGDRAETLKRILRGYATEFRQDSIAWAVAETEFLAGAV